MFWTEFLKRKSGTPLSRIWLIAHWEKKVTKLQIIQMNLDHICEEMIDPTFRNFSLRTMAYLLLGVSRVNLRKASYLYQECNEFYFKLTRDNRPTDLDVPPTRQNAVTFLEEDILNQRLSLHDFFSIDEVHHVRALWDANTSHREENLSMIEYDLRPIDEEINEFGDERSQITFEDLNLINEPNNFMSEKNDNIERNVNDESLRVSLNNEECADHEQTSNTASEPVADVSMVDISIRPEENIIIESSHEEQHVSTSHTTLIPNDQENNQFILPGVEIDQQGKRRKNRKLIVDKEIVIRSDVFRKQLTSEDNNCLDLAPPTKQLMNFKIKGNVESYLMVQPGLNFLSDKLIKYYKRNLKTKNIPNSPQLPLEFEETRKRKRVNDQNGDCQITKRPTFDKNNLPSGESICEQAGNPSSDILSRESENIRLTLEDTNNIGTQISILYPAHEINQENFEQIIVPSFDLNISSNMPQAKQSILLGPNSIRKSPKRVSFSNIERNIIEYTPEDLQSDQTNSVTKVTNFPDTETINNNIEPNVLESLPSQTNNITNLSETETNAKKKKSQKINLLKTLLPKLKNTDRLTFRNLVERKKRLEVALTFNTLLTLKKEAVIDLNQERSFSEIQISPGKNYAKYNYLI